MLLYILLLLVTAAYLLPVKYSFPDKEEISAKYDEKAAEEKEDLKKEKAYPADLHEFNLHSNPKTTQSNFHKFIIPALFHTVETPPPDLA